MTELDTISLKSAVSTGSAGGVKLQRNLSVWGGISLVIGTMIGSGIYRTSSDHFEKRVTLLGLRFYSETCFQNETFRSKSSSNRPIFEVTYFPK